MRTVSRCTSFLRRLCCGVVIGGDHVVRVACGDPHTYTHNTRTHARMHARAITSADIPLSPTTGDGVEAGLDPGVHCEGDELQARLRPADEGASAFGRDRHSQG